LLLRPIMTDGWVPMKTEESDPPGRPPYEIEDYGQPGAFYVRSERQVARADCPQGRGRVRVVGGWPRRAAVY
jgi:hypothetical protein